MAYKCSVCGMIGSHTDDCYADEVTNMMDAVDYLVLSEFFPEPTAHEAWVRDRISLDTHYDSADDGPETDSDYMAWVAHIVLGVTKAVTLQALGDVWLDGYSINFGDHELDFLVYGRD